MIRVGLADCPWNPRVPGSAQSGAGKMAGRARHARRNREA